MEVALMKIVEDPCLAEDSYSACREVAVEIQAEKILLPESAGTFEVFEFVPPGLAQYAECAPEVMTTPGIAELAQVKVDPVAAEADISSPCSTTAKSADRRRRVPERRDVQRFETVLEEHPSLSYARAPQTCQRCQPKEYARLLAPMRANGLGSGSGSGCGLGLGKTQAELLR